MSATAVTEETFTRNVLNSEKPVLVDFWASWCGPCRQVGPIVDEIATELADELTVVKLNVDENPAIALQYHVTSIPVLKLFRNGQVVHSILGARPKQAILSEIAPSLA